MNGELFFGGYTVFILQDEEKFWKWMGMMVTQH
jgi:hypothetical protein